MKRYYIEVVNDGIVEKIENVWLRSIYYDTLEDRTKEIHITDLTNPCLKSVVLSKKAGLQSFDDMDKSFLKKTWAGKQLHETAFGEKHEYAFRYKFDDEPYGYIYGSVDEILDGIIIDKKYYKFLPQKAFDHHVEQTLFYYAILTDRHERKEGKRYVEVEGFTDLRYVAVMYIERGDFNTKIFIYEPTHVELIREEMVGRARTVREGIVNGKIPKGVKSWMCNYCRFKKDCDDWR